MFYMGTQQNCSVCIASRRLSAEKKMGGEKIVTFRMIRVKPFQAVKLTKQKTESSMIIIFQLNLFKACPHDYARYIRSIKSLSMQLKFTHIDFTSFPLFVYACNSNCIVNIISKFVSVLSYQ